MSHPPFSSLPLDTKIISLGTRLQAMNLCLTPHQLRTIPPHRQSHLSREFCGCEQAWMKKYTKYSYYEGDDEVNRRLIALEGVVREEERRQFAREWVDAPCWGVWGVVLEAFWVAFWEMWWWFGVREFGNLYARWNCRLKDGYLSWFHPDVGHGIQTTLEYELERSQTATYLRRLLRNTVAWNLDVCSWFT